MSAFIRNAWYMAAWEHEIPEEGFLARRLLDKPWLLWRASDGELVMMADRCPHRFVPLSRGRREGDLIRCGYHGLAFDAAGKCVHNPFSGEVHEQAKVATVPVFARYKGVWFWAGEPSDANPDLIPDNAFLDAPTPVTHGHEVMAVNYELIADNLLDVSHAEFLHDQTFGINGALVQYGKQVVETDETGALWNRWDMDAIPPPAWVADKLGDGERVDHWLHMRWCAPSNLALHIGMARAGTNRQDLVVPNMANPHILTPETQTSTHYFFTHEPTEEAAALTRRVFLEEDEPMLQAQQEAMDGADFWELRPVILASDSAAIRARRKLMQLRRHEAAALVSTADGA